MHKKYFFIFALILILLYSCANPHSAKKVVKKSYYSICGVEVEVSTNTKWSAADTCIKSLQNKIDTKIKHSDSAILAHVGETRRALTSSRMNESNLYSLVASGTCVARKANLYSPGGKIIVWGNVVTQVEEQGIRLYPNEKMSREQIGPANDFWDFIMDDRVLIPLSISYVTVTSGDLYVELPKNNGIEKWKAFIDAIFVSRIDEFDDGTKTAFPDMSQNNVIRVGITREEANTNKQESLEAIFECSPFPKFQRNIPPPAYFTNKFDTVYPTSEFAHNVYRPSNENITGFSAGIYSFDKDIENFSHKLMTSIISDNYSIKTNGDFDERVIALYFGLGAETKNIMNKVSEKVAGFIILKKDLEDVFKCFTGNETSSDTNHACMIIHDKFSDMKSLGDFVASVENYFPNIHDVRHFVSDYFLDRLYRRISREVESKSKIDTTSDPEVLTRYMELINTFQKNISSLSISDRSKLVEYQDKLDVFVKAISFRREELSFLKKDMENRWYFHETIVKKKNFNNGIKFALSGHIVENEEQYYQRILLACLEFNCKGELIKKIMAKLSNPDFFLYDGQNPLYYAVFYGREDLVKLFLSKGSNPNPGKTAFNPLLFSLRSARWNIFNLLSKDIADLENQFELLKIEKWIPSKEIENAPPEIKSYFIKKSILPLKDKKFDGDAFFKQFSHSINHYRFEDNFENIYFFSKESRFKPKHMLGYVDFGPYLPGWSKSEILQNRFIYVFSRPSIDSKLIGEIRVGDKIYENFESEMYGYDVDGAIVASYDNFWLEIIFNGKKGWVHLSQALFFIPIDKRLSEALMDAENENNFYDNINGEKIKNAKAGFGEHGKQIHVLEFNWVKDTLWLKVEYGDMPKNKVTEKEFYWFRPFSKDGTRNYKMYPKGC
ncbi:MAG: hypothetical protein A2X86_00420 [Bdellovibrionales bacterium GWA2_49_15]|nr:MAG: hypothetical protein A2X86_00420 [Bdellovibrionales bacterium GWA2_49_15]HAZ14507.1 hypothetical protein [Bdellovibrionales bacterium]